MIEVNTLRQASRKLFSYYLNKFLRDQDPEEQVEPEYYEKHDQLLCWKFMREVLSVYQYAAEDFKKMQPNGFDVHKLS